LERTGLIQSPASAPKAAGSVAVPAQNAPGRSPADARPPPPARRRSLPVHEALQHARMMRPADRHRIEAIIELPGTACPRCSTVPGRPRTPRRATEAARAFLPPTTSGGSVPPDPSLQFRQAVPRELRIQLVQVPDFRQRRQERPLGRFTRFSTCPFSFPLATLQNRLSNRYQLRSSRNRRFRRRSRPRPT